MRRLLSVLCLTLILCGCKKSDAPQQTNPKPTPNKVFVSFSGDTLKVPFPTGAIRATASQIANLPFVEDLDSSLIPILGRVQTPTSFEISGLPTPGDQDGNSCTAWTLAHGLMSYLYAKLDYPSFIGSPAFMWNQLNNGQNVGLSIIEGLDFLKDKGICDEAYFAAHSPINKQPDASAIKNGEEHIIADYYGFKSFDLERIKSLLSRGYPLPFGITIGLDFHSVGSDSYDIVPTPSAPHGLRYVYRRNTSTGQTGTHAMLLVGYDDAIHAFKLMNSWGHGFEGNNEDWGNGGFVWMDYDQFNALVCKLNGSPDMYWVQALLVKTLPLKDIGATTATANGNVLNTGGSSIIARGFCWSSTAFKPEAIAPNLTNDGSAFGPFSSTIKGLLPNTTYRLRAYLKQSNGRIAYGPVEKFTTTSPESITVVSGNNQHAEPGGILNNPLIVIVKDANGMTVPDVTVNWSVTAGGGQIAATSKTQANGQATNSWKLGLAGSQTATAVLKKPDGSSVLGSPLTFTAVIDDSLEYYKSLVPGVWINTWDYEFDYNSGVYSFYEEDKITCYPDGTAMWTEARYVSGLVQTMATPLTWSVYRSGDIYKMQLGAQSGRITPDLSFFNTLAGRYKVHTHKQ